MGEGGACGQVARGCHLIGQIGGDLLSKRQVAGTDGHVAPIPVGGGRHLNDDSLAHFLFGQKGIPGFHSCQDRSVAEGGRIGFVQTVPPPKIRVRQVSVSAVVEQA